MKRREEEKRRRGEKRGERRRREAEKRTGKHIVLLTRDAQEIDISERIL